MTIAVTHNEPAQCFEAEVDGQISIAAYGRSGDRVTFVHTEVPWRQRNRGIAAALAQAALDWARSRRLTVVPACSYFASYMRRRPETHDLLEAAER